MRHHPVIVGPGDNNRAQHHRLAALGFQRHAELSLAHQRRHQQGHAGLAGIDLGEMVDRGSGVVLRARCYRGHVARQVSVDAVGAEFDPATAIGDVGFREPAQSAIQTHGAAERPCGGRIADIGPGQQDDSVIAIGQTGLETGDVGQAAGE